MTPVTQTIMETEWTRGNCMSAAVATILDKRIDEVPHFAVFGENWFTALILYMRDMGYEYHGMPAAKDITNRKYNKGINGYLLAFGVSPRGFQHLTVYKGSKMVHDPHPSRAGIELQGFYRFEPFGEVREPLNWIIR